MLRKSLSAAAWLFVAAMVVNTLIALRYRWPAMFDAPGRADTIATDFILNGTRISPPVHTLVILALAGWFALRPGWRGVAATLVLVAFSLLVTIAAAGEPAGLPKNDVPALLWLILGAVGRYAPLFMILAGTVELVRRATLRFRRQGQSL